MKLLHVVAGLLVAVNAAGCTSTPAPAPGTPGLAGPAASAGPLAAKLLTEDDVPVGYKSAPLPSGSDVGSGSGCPALSVKPPSAGPPDASAAFAGGAIGSLLTETLRTVSDAQATKALDELAATPERCAKFDAQALGAKVQFTTTKAALTSVGDRSVAVRLVAAAGPGPVVDQYVVAIKAGRLLIVVVMVGPGQIDPAVVQAVTRKAWQKATA